MERLPRHELLGRMCLKRPGIDQWILRDGSRSLEIARGMDTVIWDTFKQLRRPLQDYSDFGPFVFDAEQYTKAVVEIAFNNTEPRFAWLILDDEP